LIELIMEGHHTRMEDADGRSVAKSDLPPRPRDAAAHRARDSAPITSGSQVWGGREGGGASEPRHSAAAPTAEARCPDLRSPRARRLPRPAKAPKRRLAMNGDGVLGADREGTRGGHLAGGPQRQRGGAAWAEHGVRPCAA